MKDETTRLNRKDKRAEDKIRDGRGKEDIPSIIQRERAD